MRLSVLFWNFNVDRGDRAQASSPAESASVLGELAQACDADLVVLTECPLSEDLVVEALQAQDRRFDLPVRVHERFQFHTRFPAARLEPFAADSRLDVRRLGFPGFDDVLLAAIHFLDRRNHSRERQWREIANHRDTLREAEKRAGHGRLILFGDFNMNPYEVGMVDTGSGLGALMTRDLARVQSKILGRSCFYNPMWSLMGRPDAPGTFYWDVDEPLNPYWNCLDGVLLRPEVMDCVRDEDIRILRRLPSPGGGGRDFVRLARLHCKIGHSDHLPITFTLSLPSGPATEEVHDGGTTASYPG